MAPLALFPTTQTSAPCTSPPCHQGYQGEGLVDRIQASINCFRLSRQTARLPRSLARCSAGIKIAINMAIMAMTTKSSTDVNALGLFIMILCLLPTFRCPPVRLRCARPAFCSVDSALFALFRPYFTKMRVTL